MPKRQRSAYAQEQDLHQTVVAGGVVLYCPKCKSSNVLLRTPWWSCWDCGHQWEAETAAAIAAAEEANSVRRELDKARRLARQPKGQIRPV